jgi:hypothetical protein
VEAEAELASGLVALLLGHGFLAWLASVRSCFHSWYAAVPVGCAASTSRQWQIHARPLGVRTRRGFSVFFLML